MKKTTTLILPMLLVFAIQSCNNTKKTETNHAVKNVEVTDSIPIGDFEESYEPDEPQDNIPYEPNVTYPETGNKIADFVPKPVLYEVQYKGEGDLNNDGLANIAVVLKYKENNISKRPMLILLQNQDKSYRLDKVSNIVMPIEYNDSDYKSYETEDISIENGKLNINLYGMGNIFGSFKYIGNDFVLDYMEAYAGGAGGSTVLFYDVEKGEIKINNTNTMEENMPTTSETTKAKLKNYFFENTSIADFFKEI